MDEQLVAWMTQRPQDWQVDGKCDVYMFGAGRHGQLGETSSGSTAPLLVPSFYQARQVTTVHCPSVTD